MNTRILLPAVLIAMSSVAAQAQLINVNVADGDMVGVAHLGNGPTDEWNHVTFNNASTGALVDSTGYSNAAAPVTLTSSNWFIAADASTAPQPAGDGPLDGNPNLFTFYGIGAGFINPNPATLDFAGLADNQVYTLDIYGRNQPGGDGRAFTVTTTGVSGTIAETLVNAENTGFSSVLDASETASNGNPTYDGNYVQLTVKSSASGALNLSLFNGGEYDVSGLQLQAVVPEPSTDAMMLGGVGMLFFMLARKRRQNGVL